MAWGSEVSIAVLLRVQVVWNVMFCQKPGDAVSHPRRPKSPEDVFPVPFSVCQAFMEETSITFEVTVICKTLC
jgi:hypothetical protein